MLHHDIPSHDPPPPATSGSLALRGVAVVVPAFNEARLIQKTLRSIPLWIDLVVVVDDASQDATARLVRELADRRIHLVEKTENEGVGKAILDGYEHAFRWGAEVAVVLAGDNQMDPKDLPAVATPVLLGRADYVKGNRFAHPRAKDMPWHRRWAGRVLSILTGLASGVPLEDSQCGYTAISRSAAETLLGAKVWARYGYPNDVLVILGRAGKTILQTPVRPIYADETSGVRFWHAGVILGILARRLLLGSMQGAFNRNRRNVSEAIPLGRGAKSPTTDSSLPR